MAALIVGVSGNHSRPSKTRALVEAVVARAVDRSGASGIVFDLCDLAPALGSALRLNDLARDARHAVDLVIAADALVVASPVYKGSYTGLFKHLFDLIEPEALAGKPMVLAATGGGDRHALVIEHQLRPLFGFFEAATLPTGVYAAERDFTARAPSSPALLERIDRAADQLARVMGEGGSALRSADATGKPGGAASAAVLPAI